MSSDGLFSQIIFSSNSNLSPRPLTLNSSNQCSCMKYARNRNRDLSIPAEVPEEGGSQADAASANMVTSQPPMEKNELAVEKAFPSLQVDKANCIAGMEA